jgi:Ser/Thr protein kinase RdoA (MazF antagonist)
MMEHDYRHLNPNFDMDAWLDAVDQLAPGNHSARTTPADRSFVHTTGPSGEIAIRQWPQSTTAGEIAARAEVLDAIHASVGDAVPTIDRLPNDAEARTITVKDRLYTRSAYVRGVPLGRYGGYRAPDGRTINIPLPESAKAHETIAEVAGIIARAHSASEPLAESKGLPVRTLASFLDDVRKTWFEQRKILGDRAAEQRDIRRWLRCGNRIIPTSSDLLRNEPELMSARAVVNHGDLWPVNILVGGRDDRRVTGVVGWSDMSAGSAVMDVAALTVRMQGWSAALTEAVIDAYANERRLLPEERRLIPAVASLDLVAQLATLLKLAYLDEEMINHPATSVLRSGMKTLLNSLETLTGILAPDIEQTHRWVRRRPDRPGESTSRRPPARAPRKAGERGSGYDGRRPVKPRSKQR